MKTKLLVVDDEPHIRQLYQEELQAAGYDVAGADGREPLLDVIAREDPALVILDIKLGKISGLDLLQSIRAAHPALPVILNTAYDSFQYDLKSIAADAYCVKSVDLDPLKETIMQVLADRGKTGK